MRLVQFETATNEITLINPEKVVAVRGEEDQEHCIIELDSSSYVVTGTVEEVSRKLQEVS